MCFRQKLPTCLSLQHRILIEILFKNKEYDGIALLEKKKLIYHSMIAFYKEDIRYNRKKPL